MSKRYRDRDWLELMYHGRELTQAEMAERCGVSPRTIRTYLNEHGIPTREVRGRNHGLYGQERDEATKEKISETMEGREFDEAWRERLSEAHRGNEIDDETREKISDSLTGFERPWETREKMSESTSGEQNPRWKGGHAGDYGNGWPQAKRRVHHRDEVCQNCGHDGSEEQLEVHHITPIRLFAQSERMETRAGHDLENLVLLCHSCHNEAEYGDLEFESGIDAPPDAG